MITMSRKCSPGCHCARHQFLTVADHQRQMLLGFISRIRIQDDGCWLWIGYLDRNGYGRITDAGHGSDRAHIFSYELLVGAVPEGLQLDHTCRVRNCVNPSHLDPVTSRVNTLRGDTLTAKNALVKICRRGHPYNHENTYTDSRGSRHCRRCQAIAQEAYRRRKQAI